MIIFRFLMYLHGFKNNSKKLQNEIRLKISWIKWMLLTPLRFLVILKKSSMWVCLHCSDMCCFSLSSRLLSRAWWNFASRWRTLSLLQIYHEHRHNCLWDLKAIGQQKSSHGMYRCEHTPYMCGATEELNQGSFIWVGPGEFCRCSLWCIQEYLSCFFVLPGKWHWVGLMQTLVTQKLFKIVFVNQEITSTFLLTCKTTFSMVRCFWISVRALFGPRPHILSQ